MEAGVAELCSDTETVIRLRRGRPGWNRTTDGHLIRVVL